MEAQHKAGGWHGVRDQERPEAAAPSRPPPHPRQSFPGGLYATEPPRLWPGLGTPPAPSLGWGGGDSWSRLRRRRELRTEA